MRVITFYLILITFEILSQCARVCVCIIYKNNIDESVTQETFHEAKVLSFELQSDDYKIEKKPENSSSPSTWLNTFVLVRDADFIMILRSRVSSFLFTVKKRGEEGGGEIPHLAANRHKTASLRNESLGFTTHLRERYKRFILGNKKGS